RWSNRNRKSSKSKWSWSAFESENNKKSSSAASLNDRDSNSSGKTTRQIPTFCALFRKFNLTTLTQTAQSNSPAQNSGTQVNQQLQALQQLLAVNGNGQQNLLTNLIASGILGGRNASNSQPNYAELLKPPTAHTNKR
ncbi:unnamed protein product, partial [Oikopleura dioica]